MWGIENLFILLPFQNYIRDIMSTFIGKYDVKADAKGRVFIPSAYRRLLPESDRERVVMRRDPHNDCLVIYPAEVWNAKMKELKDTLDEWNPEDQLLLMQYVSEAEWLEIDSQGRVLISRKHMEYLHPESGELIFAGMVDRFVLWGKSAYEQITLNVAEKLKERMMRK
jgi:MraZ protein